DINGNSITQFACGAGTDVTNQSACGNFHVPDDYSIGISGRPFAKLLLAFDVQRIRYSQLNDGYITVFAYNPASATDRVVSGGSSDDGTLPRVGAEFNIVATSSTDVNLRAGYYHEPAHGTKVALYSDVSPQDRKPDSGTPKETVPFSEAYRTTFDGGKG